MLRAAKNMIQLHKSLSPAKLNLHLHVTGKSFHFHTLQMINVVIDFSDELTFEVSPVLLKQINTMFNPNFEQIGKNNLITRAYNKFIDFNKEINAVNVSIIKNIPPGSGLGGGSSNAAQALIFFNTLWPKFTKEQLLKVALELGSDVPFFIYGKTSRVEGIGEILSPLQLDLSGWWIVLVVPGIFLSTAEVFRKYDELIHYQHDYDLNSVRTFEQDLFPLHNDLILPAISVQPLIADLLQDIKKSGAIDASMSGSGSSCFGMYDKLDKAERARDSLTKKYPLVRLVRIVS
jgi:4-diphosphocytidyl-2-C-methyl-D-erythritol kinase